SRSHSIPTLPVPFDVGGRFSVLSPVGMFLAAWSGLDLDKFRRGAEGALTNKITVTEFTAQVLASFSRSEWITLFWFYCSELYSLGLWLQQLWAESLAKATDRRGAPAPRVSTPMCAIGASDQHSILQQVMEGARDKFVVFLRVSEAESEFRKLNAPIFSETQNLRGRGMGGLLAAEAEATEEALSHSGVSTLVLRTKVLDEQTLGYLFMFFELVVGALGEALDINAFDQPGVELGKRLAKQKMAKV
ncbi:MAG: glucose-6-phosphate isomerase, partial [Bdellovibrionaceae bacterium]|nr:glucose-6-phosphate isomerase [Pseudobdellovibrionaceae bacterium]